MSLSEILSELPKLQADELETLLSRALELQRGLQPGTVFVASPELLQAIEEAEADPEEHDIDISEAERIVKSWSTK